MILSDGRCFRCALGQCDSCSNRARCTHDCPPRGRYERDPRADPAPRGQR